MIEKGAFKYYMKYLTMISNYINEMCDVLTRLENWVIEYSLKAFGIEISRDEARQIIQELMKKTPLEPSISEVVEICRKRRS